MWRECRSYVWPSLHSSFRSSPSQHPPPPPISSVQATATKLPAARQAPSRPRRPHSPTHLAAFEINLLNLYIPSLLLEICRAQGRDAKRRRLFGDARSIAHPLQSPCRVAGHLSGRHIPDAGQLEGWGLDGLTILAEMGLLNASVSIWYVESVSVIVHLGYVICDSNL